METVSRIYFLGLQNHCRWWLQPWNWKLLAPWKKSYDKCRQHIKKQRYTLPTKVRLVKGMVFPVVMYGCESWTIKKGECWRIDVFELWCWRRLLRVLDCKEIQPVHPKGDQSWIFIGRTDAEAETPILWPPDGHLWVPSTLNSATGYCTLYKPWAASVSQTHSITCGRTDCQRNLVILLFGP